MTVIGLILKELRQRWVTAVLGVAAVAAAVALCVSLAVMQDAAARETRRVTRDMGFNIRIIPNEADLQAFWQKGYADHTMSENVVHALANHPNVAYNHLVATLQKEVTLPNGVAVLTGLSQTYFPPGAKKPPMHKTIGEGAAHVGYEVAKRHSLKKGDTLTVQGTSLTIARIMPEAGSIDDIRIIADLPQVQTILNEPSRINEIQAIDCLCVTPDENPLAQLREEIGKVAPQTQVIHIATIAEARARQRQTAQQYAGFTTSLMLVVCAIWLGVLTMMNVRERAGEIGLMRAVGFTSPGVASLFLGKAMIVGVVGACAGFLVGQWLALSVGPEIFEVTAKAIRFQPTYLLWAMIAAPLFAAAAALIPTALAVSQDPAAVLRNE